MRPQATVEQRALRPESILEPLKPPLDYSRHDVSNDRTTAPNR